VGRPENAGELAELHRGLFDKPWDVAAFQGLLSHPGSTAFLARLGSPIEMVGFVVGQLAADEAEILTLGVRTRPAAARHRPQAGGGAGARVKKAEARRLFLEVGAGNAAALVSTVARIPGGGRRKGYYQHTGGAPRML
jgi:ribosomal-protein-alanine N-acetyltransferase